MVILIESNRISKDQLKEMQSTRLTLTLMARRWKPVNLIVMLDTKDIEDAHDVGASTDNKCIR